MNIYVLLKRILENRKKAKRTPVEIIDYDDLHIDLNEFQPVTETLTTYLPCKKEVGHTPWGTKGTS